MRRSSSVYGGSIRFQRQVQFCSHDECSYLPWLLVSPVSSIRFYCETKRTPLSCREVINIEDTAFWFVRCSHVSLLDQCEWLKYTDKFDLTSFVRFIRAVNQPMTVSGWCLISCKYTLELLIEEQCDFLPFFSIK